MDSALIEDEWVSSLSRDQEKVLSVLFVISGLMSVFGSSTIVHRVIGSIKENKSYDRIMLGLSVADIISSISYIFCPFLLPTETSLRVWAWGSDLSCQWLGFLTQLSFGAVWYNICLSYYFLATLRFGIKPIDFECRFEPYIHPLIIFVSLFTATGGFVFSAYSEYPLGIGCWISELPENCYENGGCVGTLVGWLFGGVALMLAFLSLPMNYCVIFLHVRRNLQYAGTRTAIQKAQIRMLVSQGFLYVITFFMAYSPQLALRILGSNFKYRYSKEQDIYWLLILNSVFLPLQGFFNMFIYSRPAYYKLRSVGLPVTTALRGACFESNVPKMIEETIRLRTTKHDEISKDELSRKPKKNPFRQSRADLSGDSHGKNQDDASTAEDESSRKVQQDGPSDEPRPTATQIAMDGSLRYIACSAL